MTLSLNQWHHRFTQQAAWTQAARQYLYRQAGLEHCSRILEVGCGTGAILKDFSQYQTLTSYGIDIQLDSVRFAKNVSSNAKLIAADGFSLPFSNRSFDCVCCHYYLLWCHHPQSALREMARVTNPGGSILLLAEPDYDHRIDEPEELKELGKQQTKSLSAQGADVSIGSKLGAWLCAADINVNQIGLLSNEWAPKTADPGFDLEWEMIAHDLDTLSEEEIQTVKSIDRTAYQKGIRILFVPTFYAWGVVK